MSIDSRSSNCFSNQNKHSCDSSGIPVGGAPLLFGLWMGPVSLLPCLIMAHSTAPVSLHFPVPGWRKEKFGLVGRVGRFGVVGAETLGFLGCQQLLLLHSSESRLTGLCKRTHYWGLWGPTIWSRWLGEHVDDAMATSPRQSSIDIMWLRFRV